MTPYPADTPSGIIVADNDAILRGVLRSMLVGVGQTVFLAASGKEALEYGAKVDAKLVLLDLDMPCMNGLVVCERLRRTPRHAHTPIVILTAMDDPAAQRAAGYVGATLFLTKPFQAATLLEALLPHLSLGPATRDDVVRAARRARETAVPAPQWGSGPWQAGPPASGRNAQALNQGRAILEVYRP